MFSIAGGSTSGVELPAMAEAKKPHDHTQAERVFVRGIEGQYNLTQELNRLRSLPRVRKGSKTPFSGYPKFTTACATSGKPSKRSRGAKHEQSSPVG
jgi:hypothetical protein